MIGTGGERESQRTPCCLCDLIIIMIYNQMMIPQKEQRVLVDVGELEVAQVQTQPP